MSLRAAAITALALSSVPAYAVDLMEPHTGDRPMLVDVHAGLALSGFGLAAGGRFSLPIIKNGFLKKLNNSFYVTVGADFYYTGGLGGYGVGVGVPVTGQWNFYFTEKFSAFGEAGVNIYFSPYFFQGNVASLINPGWLMADVGGRYHLNEKMAIIARVGSPYTAIGIEFAL